MIKSLQLSLVFGVLSFASISVGQNVFSSSDIPSSGKYSTWRCLVKTNKIKSDIGLYDGGKNGANCVWDYSFIGETGYTNAVEVKYDFKTGLSGKVEGFTITSPVNSRRKNIEYRSVSDDEISSIMITEKIPFVSFNPVKTEIKVFHSIHNDPGTQITFPFTLNSSYKDVSEYKRGSTINEITSIITYRSAKAIGNGTLKLPSRTIHNALKVEKSFVHIDSSHPILIKRVEWYAPGNIVHPVLQFLLAYNSTAQQMSLKEIDDFLDTPYSIVTGRTAIDPLLILYKESSPNGCLAGYDFNENGRFNYTDLEILRDNLTNDDPSFANNCSGNRTFRDGDVNKDGCVTSADVVQIYSNQHIWGKYFEYLEDGQSSLNGSATTLIYCEDLGVDFSQPAFGKTGTSSADALKWIKSFGSLASSSFANTNIYPNPTRGELNIKNIPSSSFIQVLDLQGRQVFENNNELGINGTLNLSHLSKGPYILKVSSGTDIFTQQFSKVE